ncbi:MAG: [protein-PII] uridylyltransferase family protein, partial [Acidimicrobiales bacterium]
MPTDRAPTHRAVVTTLAEDIERCADPAGAAARIEGVIARQPDAGARLAGDPALASALVAVTAASPWLARVCATDPAALDVLDDLDRRVDAAFLTGRDGGDAGARAAAAAGARPATHHAADVDVDVGAWLARWKQLEVLRVAARDLIGLDGLEAVGEALADLAGALLGAAYDHLRSRGPEDAAPLAVVGMGKLGARELNYASDVDLLLVGAGDPRPLLALARQTWRVDLDLRPEGRSGPLVRSLASYRAYWDRWAETWEFQSLLKGRPVAGSAELGAAFAAEAAGRVWGRPFGAEELRQVRQIKVRTEEMVARRGLSDRELKLGRGGIRDIEFAVQLLQLVHGRADPSLRVPATLAALGALADGGYVAASEAAALAGAYRFLRSAEHRLQLREDQPVHALPRDDTARTTLARALGFRDGPSVTARAAFERDLRRHQATVRSIHERLFFR